MKIYLVSDMHLEFGQYYTLPEEPMDLVVMAGDIDRGYASALAARSIQTKMQVPVLLVAGNHEFYRGDWHGTLVELRKEARLNPDVHFLEQDAVVVGDTRFLGCTLWSNFEINGQTNAEYHQNQARTGIRDFSLIAHNGQRLQPDAVIQRFRQAYEWLDAELSKPFAGKTVVITHFGPHRAAIHARYLTNGMDALTPYFVSDCSDLMERHRIDAWFYGHTHNSVDVIVNNGTRLVANSMGYPNEDAKYTQFDPHKIVSI